jgi:catechol 2,3-dioxygenase-like lactoylglutathione lyase family enzyme
VRIHHVALRSHDVARLGAFYEGALGLRVLQRDEARGSVWLDAAGTVLMLEPADATEPVIPAGSQELLAFAVDDKEAWRGRIAVEAETAHTLYFRDPDGRRLAVSSYPFAR